MAMSYQVTEQDIPEIKLALQKLLAKSPAQQMKYAEIDTALAYIKQAASEDRAWICRGYLVLYDVGSDWYSSKRYLIEQLILRVYLSTTAPVTTAIAFLAERAQAHGCVAVAAGDTQIGYMTQHYITEGYHPIGRQFFKEIN